MTSHHREGLRGGIICFCLGFIGGAIAGIFFLPSTQDTHWITNGLLGGLSLGGGFGSAIYFRDREPPPLYNDIDLIFMVEMIKLLAIITLDLVCVLIPLSVLVSALKGWKFSLFFFWAAFPACVMTAAPIRDWIADTAIRRPSR